MLTEEKNIIVKRYVVDFNPDFNVYVIADKKEQSIEYYITHKDYGVNKLIFGYNLKDDMIENNCFTEKALNDLSFSELNYAIRDYKENVMYIDTIPETIGNTELFRNFADICSEYCGSTEESL